MGAIDLSNKTVIEPQKGPQSMYIACEADIAIFGGAAGGGKSYGLLIDPLRHLNNKHFGGTIFRKTAVQVRSEGGLWDESMLVYPLLGGMPRESRLEWSFPSGMNMSFTYLEYEKDVLNYQGSQMPWQGWDELTHFSLYQFFYMLSRNRSAKAGVKPRVRATCNPDPDSWVREFIDWWIGEDGFPIPERSGLLRWFIRLNDEFIWADTKEEIFAAYGAGEEIQPKSVTFIPSKLQDNKILMKKDPSYLANLLAQDRVTRARLLDGNWNVRASAGSYFRREWFEVIDAIPAGFMKVCRYWDRAATKPNESNKDPDWTQGLKLYKYPNGTYVVADLRSDRNSPLMIEQLIKNTASFDGYATTIYIEQDPGSSGVADAQNYVRLLSGFDVRVTKPTVDKETRARPVSAQCEAGNIKVLRGTWNNSFFTELENFPEGKHDDIVDVLSGAFNENAGNPSMFDVYNKPT